MRQRDLALIKTLLDLGHEVNSKCGHDTALMKACFLGSAGVVNLLLERGADPNIQNTYDGRTALGVALPTGCLPGNPGVPVIRLLLQAGADVAVTNKQGKTVLQQALDTRCSRDVLDLLLQSAKKRRE